MAEHWLFLGNLASHWVFLMGGIAGVIIAAVEALRKKPWAPAFWVAGSICLIASADRAWQDEHRNTEAVKTEKAATSAAANTCLQNTQLVHAYTLGLEGSYRAEKSQLDNQQGLVNHQQQAFLNVL